MTAQELVDRLLKVGPVWPTQHGWLAPCPRHAWQRLGLSVIEVEGGLSLVCWDGCDPGRVMAALAELEAAA